MLKAKSLILIKQREPDAHEQAVFDALKGRGEAVGFVFIKFPSWNEKQPCTTAYSKHEDLLDLYDNAEVISSKSGGAKGVVPNGFPALPDGYALHKVGPAYWKLVDPDGEQIGKAKLKKDMIPFIKETLSEA